MAGQTVPVSVSAFRPILCPSHLHKTDETGGSPSEGEGNQTHCIPGRHIDPVQLLGHPNQPVEICQGPVSGAGPSHQREEISARPLPRNYVPGPGNFNYYNASVTSQREGGPDSAGGQAITGHVRSISPEVSNVGGQDNSCKAGNSSGSTVPSPPSSSDKQSGSISILHRGGEIVLPPNGGIIGGSQTGTGMVDTRNARAQWGSIDDGYCRHGDRVRCFSSWLGCNHEGPRAEDGRTVVNQRTRDAHQLPGITGGITGNSNFCQREEEHQDISEDRQYINQSIHRSLWGNSLMADESLSHADMEVVHRAPDILDGRASPRGVESRSRRGVKNNKRSLRLDAPPTFVLTDQGEDGSPRSGHFCISSHTPTPTLLQLEARPSSGSNRCICSRLESFSGVCKPSVVPPPAYTCEDSREKAKVVLVAPIWKTQPWYPLLLQLLCGYPLLIPLQQDAVISPTQEEFIMPEGVPRLAAWPLSGIKADQEGFLKELHIYWSPHGGARPSQHMSLSSNVGIIGDKSGVEIPLGVL